MNTWFRKVGVGAIALTLAGVLGGCNSGGGLIRLFFGVNGNGSCNQIIVEVDLDQAGAVIARDAEEQLQCFLNSVLDGAGCDVSFNILENGNLRASISGCTIPAVTNLFACDFEDVDLSELQETASAICSCKNAGCDENPPICISEDEDPTFCEDCTNGEDDDGNGKTDCEDENCRNHPACQETTTTTSTTTSNPGDTSTTTNSVTTTSTSTTSTTNEPALTCRVVFHLDDDVTLGALQWLTDYSDVPGFLLGSGAQAECAKLLPEVDGAIFNDKDNLDPEVLDSGFIDVDGFSGPADLAECTFKATITPQKSDFLITVTEATDATAEGLPVEPKPGVSVSTIDCEGTPVTTTTTIPDVTTTTTIGTVTTTTIGGNDPANYAILFTLTQGADVAALQVDVDYTGAPGAFQGAGNTVTCTKGTNISVFAPNDNEATSVLTLGFVELDGFSATKDVATCTFNGTAGDPPVPGDFQLTIVDAVNTADEPVNAVVIAAVTAL